MNDEIAKIWIGAELDLGSVERDIKKIENKKVSLSVVVDDEQLTALNKHFDLKRKDYTSLLSFFSGNPLVVKVNDSSLTRLNQTFKNFGTTNIPVAIDDRDILKSIGDVRKLIEAQQFKPQVVFDKQHISNQIADAVKNASNNPNLSLSIKLKESSNSRGNNSEIVIGLKNVEKAVKEKPKEKGLIGNVLTGFQEQIGSNLQREVSRGIKDTFGKDAGVSARKVVKSATGVVKQTFFDNSEFIDATNKVDEILGNRLRQTAYKLGDGIVAGLENREGDIKAKINSAIKAATDGVDFTSVGESLKNEIKESVDLLKGGLFNQNSLGKLTEPVGQTLSSYRERALQERAIPLVRERAVEILNQKLAKNSAKVVDENTKEIIIASGGYAGARGLSGARLAQEFNKQKVEGRQAIWIKNSDSDLPKESMSIASKKLEALLTSLAKPNLRGYSKDALEMAAQGLAAHERNPQITIKLLGESGGGFVAEEASKILDLLGIKNNFIGVGTPNFIGGLDKKERKIISPDEVLGAETNKLYGRIGLAKINKSQQILGVTGHPYENYRDKRVAELQNFIQGSPGQLTTELMSDFKTGANFFKKESSKKLDTQQTEKLAEAAYANLQHIRRFLLEANDNTRNELEEVVNDFESVFIKLSPESRDFREVRQSLTKAKEYLVYLQKQPGIEASIVANKVAKELEVTKKNFEKAFGNTSGVTQKKYELFQQELSKTQQALLSPSLGLPLPQNVKAYQKQKDLIGSNMLSPRREVDFTVLQPKVKEEVKSVQSTTEEVEKHIREKIEYITNIIDNFQNLYKNSFKSAVKTGNKEQIQKIGSELLGDYGGITGLIRQIKSDIGVSGIGGKTENNSLNQLLSRVERSKNEIVRKFNVNKIDVPDFESTGKQINKGLGVGLESLDVTESAEKLVELVKETVEEGFEIKSPSRWAIGIGQFLVEGLNQGLKTGLDISSNLIEPFKNGITSGIDNLISQGLKLGVVYAGITQTLPIVNKFAQESIAVAKEMQSLTRQVSFSAGGGTQGSNFVNDIRKTAEDLRLDIRNTLERSAGFKTATEGTSIEGVLGDETFKNFQKLLASRSTDKNKANNFLVALEQSASKGLQAEELRGQMAEAVPGIISIFARSQGQNNKQFLNKMRSTTGGLDQSVLFEASQQAAAESQLSLTSSFDTLESSLANLDNKVLKLQENVGNVFLPFEKLKTDVISSAIDTLVNNAGVLSKILLTIGIHLNSGLIIQGFTLIGNGLKTASIAARQYIADLILMNQIQTAGMTKMQAAQAMASKGFSSLSNSVSGFVNAAKPLLAIGIGLEAIRGTAEGVSISFSDMSGEVGRFAANAEKANKALLENKINKDNIDFANNPIDTYKKEFERRDLLGKASLVINPFDNEVRKGQVTTRDTIEASKKLLAETKKTRETTDTGMFQNEIKNLAEIDVKLKDIRVKSEALSKLNPGDSDALKRLREQESALSEQRATSVLTVGKGQSALDARIKELNLTKEALKKQAEGGFLSEDQYNKGIRLINDELKASESQIDKITKAIGKTKTAFDLVKKSITDLTVSLEDTKLNIESSSVINKERLINSKNSGLINQGDLNYLSSTNDIRTNQQQLQAYQTYVNQQNNNFRNPEASRVLKAYNVNDGTGVNKINQLAETVESENSKFVLQEFAKLQQTKQEIANIKLRIAESNQQLINTLIDLTKQVNDYYQQIYRNAQTTKLEIQKINLQTNQLSTSNRLRSVLSDGYDTIIGSIVDGIEQAMNSFNSIADKTIESQQQLLQSSFDIQDANRSGTELLRNIPNELPSVKVDLDFSSIPSDNNVAILEEQVDKTIGGTENIGFNIKNLTEEVQNMGREMDRNVEPLTQQNQLLDAINHVMGKNNDDLSKASDLSSQWNNAIAPIQPQFDSINNSLGGMLGTIGSLVSRTIDWVGSLTGVPDLLQKAQGFVSGIFGGNQSSTGQSSQGVIAPVSQGITSEFGMRTHPVHGDRRLHKGIDFGAPIGTEVKAPTAGRVTGYGFDPQGGGNVLSLESIDAAGRKIVQKFLHLSDAVAKVGQEVKQGDIIAKSGNSGTGTGAHLDWRMTINGQQINPRDFMKMNINIPGGVQKVGNQPSISNNMGGNLTGNISRGGNTLSQQELNKLTPLGRKLYQYQQNPNVLAIGDVISRAEGTDFRGNSKNFGYTMRIGGSHADNLATHGFTDSQGNRNRPLVANSTAFGRYQMMDFNWSNTAAKRMNGGWRSDLSDVFQGDNPGSASPGVQDLYFVYSLYKRGVLDNVLKGDFQGALSNKNLASHYASLQSGGNRSAYRGQGTPEGQLRNTIAFAQERSRSRGMPTTIAANTFRAAMPSQLQNSVNAGRDMAVQTIQSRTDAQQRNNRAQIDSQRIQGDTALNRVKRNTDRYVLEQREARLDSRRQQTDLDFESIAFPTRQQRNTKESTDNLRKFQDIERNQKKRIDESDRAIKQGRELIDKLKINLSEAATPDQKKVFITGIEQAERTIKESLQTKKQAQSILKDTQTNLRKSESSRIERSNFDEYIRQSKIQLDIEKESNSELQQRINILEKIKEVSPFDSKVSELPALREKLSTSELNIDTASKLLESEETVKRSGNDSLITKEQKKIVTSIQEQYKSRLENIKLIRQQQDEEEKLARIDRDIKVDKKVSEVLTQYNEERVKFIERLNSKDAFGIDTGELSNARSKLAMEQVNSINIQLRDEIKDINLFGKSVGLSSEQVEWFVENLKTLNKIKLDNIKQELDDTLDTDRINEFNKVLENQQTKFTLSRQPKLDLLNAKADRYEQRGGNVFVANSMRRKAGREQEMFDRNQKLMQLDRDVLQAKLKGIETPVEEVESLRNSIIELSEIKLDNLNNQFKDISTSLGDIAKNGISQFSQGLSDLITKGGSIGDVFKNLFDNILNQSLNMGINSLLSGIFNGDGLFGNKKSKPKDSGGGIFSSILGGLTGGGGFLGGILGGLFADGGLVGKQGKLKGNVNLGEAFRKERQLSGRQPELVISHRGELMIPANRVEDLERQGVSVDSLLGRKTFADGGIVGSMGGMRSQEYGGSLIQRNTNNKLNIEYNSTQIAGQNYVTEEQFQEGIRRAAEEGGRRGASIVENKMSNSTNYRRSLGI